MKFRIFDHKGKWYWQLLRTESALTNGARVIACALNGFDSAQACREGIEFLQSQHLAQVPVEVLK